MSPSLAADSHKNPIQMCGGVSNILVPSYEAVEPGCPVLTHTCWFWRGHGLSPCRL